MVTAARIAYGDWQTPPDLAHRALARVIPGLDASPRTVLEPTCGEGAFLAAAAAQLPSAALHGYDINPRHLSGARSRLPGARLKRADFFTVDWEREMAAMAEPILVLGNPPWVTSADLGALGAANAPERRNFKGLSGLDALTGKGNFDVSEWMILRLCAALAGREACLAMLCKSAVARRVIELTARQQWPVHPGAIFRIDAGRHFDAAVDAVLFVCRIGSGHSRPWPLHTSLDSPSPETTLGLAEGNLVADLPSYERTRYLAGQCDPEWRSGLKHDCARVMELSRRDSAWVNGEGEVVDVEPEARYPLLKSSDVANDRPCGERAVIVPQRALGEDTTALRERAPRLWAYLDRYRDALSARKSAVYRRQPPFAVFGIGGYSFAPWKVAVSGLYKRLCFRVIGPYEGRPVMLDDTCYFLPFESEQEARRAAEVLRSDLAAAYFRGRVFWDAKRPISKAVLQALDLRRLARAMG